MTDAPITLTIEELADVLRHHLLGHGALIAWERLTPSRQDIWRETAKVSAASLLSRRAEIAAAERRRG